MNTSHTSRFRGRPVWWALAGLTALALGIAFLLPLSRPSETKLASAERTQLAVRDGLFRLPGTSDPFTGMMTDSLPDGTLRLRSAVVEGQLHGESLGWFTNGVPELQEEFQRGVAHGLRTTWYPNGQMRSQGRLVSGKQDGVYRQWNESGVLTTEAVFEAGQPHGLSRAWHADGSLKAEVRMDHGQVQERHVYPPGTRWEPSAGIETEITFTASPRP
jgi:MORN repeat variant